MFQIAGVKYYTVREAVHYLVKIGFLDMTDIQYKSFIREDDLKFVSTLVTMKRSKSIFTRLAILARCLFEK
jgi:hypothetical protein